MCVYTARVQHGIGFLTSRGWSQGEKNPDTTQVRVDSSGISFRSLSHSLALFASCRLCCWVLGTSLTSCMTGKEVILGWLCPPCRRKNPKTKQKTTFPALLQPVWGPMRSTSFSFSLSFPPHSPYSSFHPFVPTHLLLLPYLSIYPLLHLKYAYEIKKCCTVF